MRALIIFGVVLIISLVVLIGIKMSAEAIGILIGVIIGVMAAMPTSIILVWALVRRTQTQAPPEPHQQQPYPPVIVIGGNGTPVQLPGYQQQSLLPPPRRNYRVVGDDFTEGDFSE